jgi:hypothetical protein
MYGSPSVRTEWSQSVIFLFFPFCAGPVVCTEHECHGWTDKFQLFCQYVRMSRMDRQVSVISVQFQFSRIQSSKSVRPYGGPNQKKEKKYATDKHKTQIRSGNTLNVTDGTIQEQTCRTINITFSICAMQYNAQYNTMQNAIQTQCNTMQCNAMQCNVRVRPSVRNEVSQSFFFFLIFFWSVRHGSPSVCTEHECLTDGQTSFSYFLVSMYECHGWTDKFQLFQFSFSSAHTVK